MKQRNFSIFVLIFSVAISFAGRADEAAPAAGIDVTDAGIKLYCSGDVTGAVALWRSAKAEDAVYVKAQDCICRAAVGLFEQKEYAKAFELWRSIPSEVGAPYELAQTNLARGGVTLANEGSYGLAIEALESVSERVPSAFNSAQESLYALGNLFLSKKLYGQARRAFTAIAPTSLYANVVAQKMAEVDRLSASPQQAGKQLQAAKQPAAGGKKQSLRPVGKKVQEPAPQGGKPGTPEKKEPPKKKSVAGKIAGVTLALAVLAIGGMILKEKLRGPAAG